MLRLGAWSDPALPDLPPAVEAEYAALVAAGWFDEPPAQGEGGRPMPASVDTLRAAAARLVERGYALVVAGGKAPLVVAGQRHGLRDASRDPAEVGRRLAAAGRAAARLSVACGGPDGPVVLDADGPCAVAVVERLAAEAGAPVDRSPHGAHAFFGPDPSVRRRTRRPGDRLPGCDHEDACWVDVLAAASSGGPGSLCVVYRPDVLSPVWALPLLPADAFAAALPPPPAPAPRPALPAGPRPPGHPGTVRSARPRAVLAHAVAAIESAPPGTRHDALLRHERLDRLRDGGGRGARRRVGAKRPRSA